MTIHPLFLELKNAREAKGLTLEQISDITRIAETSLEAIERGEVSILPQAYVRAFIREYADTVGLDPAELMRKYDAMKTGGTESTPAADSVPSVPASVPGPERRTAEKLFTASAARFALGIASVAALGVLLWNILGKTASTPTEEIPFQSVLADKDRRLSPPPSSSPTVSPVAAAAAPSDSLTLRGFTSDTVWVMVSTDQTDPREFIFKPNVRFAFKAKTRFSVTLGNAGAVTFTLNQKELGTLGKPGSIVRNYEITRASLTPR
jgi:cytoskeleton protein RodZ